MPTKTLENIENPPRHEVCRYVIDLLQDKGANLDATWRK